MAAWINAVSFSAGILIIGVIGTVAVAVFFRTPKRAIASESVLP